ncbi:MFS transporter [Paramicrobacterium chengjingii]|uniref:MFS transporter n=1 Tax=Paramicrobacterium chengjingii TaxID=2769067 RepID=A0ABX6YHR1_9MICO|nr:MFS transporter [Microbacterium chengjingii]QPZ37920.1 MFS transporter [Microbacterium chengjingii]
MTRTPPRTEVSRAARRARLAVGLLFLTNGALLANILPRYPEIKAELGMDNALYGLALAAFPTGAIVAGLTAAGLIRRFGSARLETAGTILTSLGLLGAAFAPVSALFAASLFTAGAMDSITDVAQNAHGLRVQRRYGRSIINSFHALWSIGAVLGGSMSAAAIALQLPVSIHLSISAAAFSAVAIAALTLCLPGPDADTDAHATVDADATSRLKPRRIALLLAAFVLIGMAGAFIEDGGNSWATLYLRDSLDAPGALAATGFIALVGAQFVGRLIGDGLVDRFGERAVARAGGVVVVVGMGSALAFPSVPGTIAGFAAAGLGVATLIPAAMHEADSLPGLRPGSGLTIVSWLLRLGFLLGPPLVGLVSETAGLRTGLLIVPISGALVVLLAGALKPARRLSA